MERKRQQFLEQALERMFQAVGFAGYDAEFVRQPDWYRCKSWTAEQEAEFRRWFVAVARQRLRLSQAGAEREAGWFLLAYGWTTGAVVPPAAQ